MKDMEKIKTIADYYGYEKQKMQLIEEMGELMQAINQKDRAELIDDVIDADYHLMEELVDVKIMIDQMIYLKTSLEEAQRMREYKLNRQLERIDEDEKNNRQIPVICGVHDIHYRGGSQVYIWRVPEGMDMPNVGDVVVVNTVKGVDNMIVVRTGYLPYSEAKHHKAAIRKAVLEDGQDL